MSLTNRRRPPGSGTSSIMRAGSPSESGREANSAIPTLTPASRGRGAGTGSNGSRSGSCINIEAVSAPVPKIRTDAATPPNSHRDRRSLALLSEKRNAAVKRRMRRAQRHRPVAARRESGAGVRDDKAMPAPSLLPCAASLSSRPRPAPVPDPAAPRCMVLPPVAAQY